MSKYKVTIDGRLRGSGRVVKESQKLQKQQGTNQGTDRELTQNESRYKS